MLTALRLCLEDLEDLEDPGALARLADLCLHAALLALGSACWADGVPEDQAVGEAQAACWVGQAATSWNQHFPEVDLFPMQPHALLAHA